MPARAHEIVRTPVGIVGDDQRARPQPRLQQIENGIVKVGKTGIRDGLAGACRFRRLELARDQPAAAIVAQRSGEMHFIATRRRPPSIGGPARAR
jgi:hypothetical protein